MLIRLDSFSSLYSEDIFQFIKFVLLCYFWGYELNRNGELVSVSTESYNRFTIAEDVDEGGVESWTF